jgi:hypothetical protein
MDKLVPIEPTEEMIDAAEEDMLERRNHGMQIYAADVWGVMVRAAPSNDDLIAVLHRVHNALIDPSRPRQAVGEMVAYLLAKAGAL